MTVRQKKYMLRLMGRKRGMTQIFDKHGNVVVCSVVSVEPNVITQIKTKGTDGYEAIQLGFETVKKENEKKRFKRVNKPRVGLFEKAGVDNKRFLLESFVETLEDYKLGQELGVGVFEKIIHVDVTGVSKGKGFQGVVKLHGFSGGPAAHGSGFHRTAGSTGMRSTPGRCLPGGKRASQMGQRKVTAMNLKLVRVDVDKGLLLVEGAIPGAKGDLVYVREAIKKS